MRVLRWLGCPMATGGDAKGGPTDRTGNPFRDRTVNSLSLSTHASTHSSRGRKERRKKRERRVGKKEGESGYNVTSRRISRVTNGVGETPAAS